MEKNLDFIINAIRKVAKTDRIEGLERSKIVAIHGTKKGFFKNEKILITIERSQDAPYTTALVSADINGNRKSEDVLKEILYDIIERTEMLDTKLNMKLDIVFNEREILFEDGKLIIE